MSAEKCQCGHIHSEHLFGVCMSRGMFGGCLCMSWRPVAARNAPSEPLVPPVGAEQPESAHLTATPAERAAAGFQYVHLGGGVWGWRKGVAA